MDEQANIPRKKQPIRPTRFFIYWVLLYLGMSLFGDFIWHTSGISDLLLRLVSNLSQMIDLGDYLWRPLILISITSIFLLPFYWLQKRLITRLFHIDIRYWILFTWLGWVAAYIVLDTIRVGMPPDDITSFNIRFAVVLILTVALIQWWLLRQQLRFAWMWLAAHLVFMFGNVVLSIDYIYHAIQLYSTPTITPSDNHITYKLMATIFGMVTGGALLWIRHAQPKTKIIETEASQPVVVEID